MNRSFTRHRARIIAVLATATGMVALSPARAEQILLYNGDKGTKAGITAGNWGGGAASFSTEEMLVGDATIAITTRDFYQGGRLVFQNPTDLLPILRQPNAYLALTLKANPRIPMSVEGSYASKVKLRAILIGEKQSFEIHSQGGSKSLDLGWVMVALPLTKLGTDIQDGDFRLKEMVITAEWPSSLYIAQIAALNDDAGITADAQYSSIGGTWPYEPVMFTGTARGGLTALRLFWDFDASDGIQFEAEGPQVEHSFAKPGKYQVTLTARPLDGAQKTPAASTITIEISRPQVRPER